MHRTFSVPRLIGWWSFLIALTLQVGVQAVSAQTPLPALQAPGNSDNPRPVIQLAVGSSRAYQMISRADLKRVENPNSKIVRVERIADKNNEILLVGENPGRTLLTFVDQKDQVETHEIIVQEINKEVVAQPKTSVLKLPVDTREFIPFKKGAKKVEQTVDNEAIVNVIPDLANARFRIEARKVGKARITLNVDGVVEVIEVFVTTDDRVMQLRRLIAEIAPTAGVTATGTKIAQIVDGKLTEEEAVILTGTVTNALDAVAIAEAAKRLFPATTLGTPSQNVTIAQASGAGGGGGGGGGGAGSGIFTSILQGNVINRIMVAGVHQVQLEVVVAIVNRSELRNMSFSFSSSGSKFFVGSIFGGDQFASALATGIAAATGAQNSTANLPFAIQSSTGSFMGFLQALRTEGVTKILSEPRLTTLSGRPASIVSGGQVPVLVGSNNGTSTVEYKDFGTKVNFLPIVLGNGKIHLEVAAEISDVDPTLTLLIGGIQPTSISGFRKRSAQVTVQIEDGQTLAIGGLIQNTVRGQITRVPFLGDLPFVGAAFSTKSFNEVEEEMVIIVTPRLVDGVDCCKIPKNLPGRETRSPDDFELFLEGILEAPRGQRNLGHPYRPAFHGSANAGQYPCADGSCGVRSAGCADGNCAANNLQLTTTSTAMPRVAMPMPSFPEVKGTPTSNPRVIMEPELPSSFPPIREIPGSLGPVTPTAPLPPARQQDVRPVLPPISPR